MEVSPRNPGRIAAPQARAEFCAAAVGDQARSWSLGYQSVASHLENARTQPRHFQASPESFRSVCTGLAWSVPLVGLVWKAPSYSTKKHRTGILLLGAFSLRRFYALAVWPVCARPVRQPSPHLRPRSATRRLSASNLGGLSRRVAEDTWKFARGRRKGGPYSGECRDLE